MPLVDEESALSLPTSPVEQALDERATNNLSSATTPQHEQPSTPMLANHIPATQGFNRHSSDSSQKKKKKPEPKLLHPILHRIPMHFRFGFTGFLSNVLFMIAYNAAVVKFEKSASSSTIYAVVYLFFIPISHVLISLLVFGWPERYVRSLMSNTPVGITAIVLGAALTAYLDDIEFNEWVAEAVTEYHTMMGFTIAPAAEAAATTGDRKLTASASDAAATMLEKEAARGGGEFYSSLFVLIVTSIWTFVLSVMVNAPAESLEKKEL